MNALGHNYKQQEITNNYPEKVITAKIKPFYHEKNEYNQVIPYL